MLPHDTSAPISLVRTQQQGHISQGKLVNKVCFLGIHISSWKTRDSVTEGDKKSGDIGASLAFSAIMT